ncbi:hypothetical protein KKF38_00910 [Patescibacteria group bacterium]|nr:hypothetical protein [Patescibacteria group bacterium]
METEDHIEESLSKLDPPIKNIVHLGLELGKFIRWISREAIKRIGVLGVSEKKN